MIQFSCEKCKKAYRIPDNFAGKKVRCKQCGVTTQVPVASHEKTGSDESVAAFNQLLEQLAQDEKTLPAMESDD